MSALSLQPPMVSGRAAAFSVASFVSHANVGNDMGAAASLIFSNAQPASAAMLSAPAGILMGGGGMMGSPEHHTGQWWLDGNMDGEMKAWLEGWNYGREGKDT